MSGILTRPRVRPSSRDEAIDWVASHWQVLTVATIALGAFAIRIIKITSDPPGFFADEAAVGYLADLILHKGRDQFGAFMPLFFKNFGDDKLGLTVYADMPFVAIFGRTEFAVRSMVAIAGSLTIVTTYLMAKELFRRDLPAMLTAACLALMPWHIHYSRTGFGETVLFVLLLTGGLYLLLRSIRRETSLVPAAFVFGLSLYSYRAGWVVLPPLFLVLAALYWQEVWRNPRNLLLAVSVLSLMAVPIFVHLLTHSGDRAEQAWIFNANSKESTPLLFWDYYRSYFSTSFLFKTGDNGMILRHYLPGQGELYWFQAPLMVIGFASIFFKANKPAVVVLALLVFCPLGGALSADSPHSLRALAQTIPLALLTAMGAVVIIDALTTLAPERHVELTMVAIGGLAMFAAVGFGTYERHYFRDYPAESAGFWGWQDGPQQIMTKFLQVQDQYDELFMDGYFNAPAVFIPFYTGTQCPKCHIGDSRAYDPEKRQLFALRTDNLRPDDYDYVLRGEVELPGNTVGFVLVEISQRR